MYLETERLIIRNWQPKDYKDLFEFASDKEVTKYLLYETYTSEQQAVERINSLLETYKESDQIGDFAIELKKENKVIGSLCLTKKTEKAGGIIELGWSLNRKYQGFGYMTESISSLLKYIKTNHLAKRIVAVCDAENTKSSNVMKRIGMQFEGIARKASDNNHHNRHDLVYYSILEEEIK